MTFLYLPKPLETTTLYLYEFEKCFSNRKKNYKKGTKCENILYEFY